ncbi:hypothetical protein NC653_018527 [Populus alba x Populus x berolinensis]|uniref:Uncharacterized protein n=1 Tax=Populus alba x Populus x berolinensis TaxID=444605 RepID=A0AAD6VVN2_9ROSI|nr:hypothetical protein NC653_018527 [Populus alba x Populus x berolinensis]
MGLLHFGGGGEGSGDRRLRDKEGCLVHGGGRGGEGEIGVLLQHGRKMCTRLCSGLWLLLWRSGLVWRSSRGTSLNMTVIKGGGGGRDRGREDSFLECAVDSVDLRSEKSVEFRIFFQLNTVDDIFTKISYWRDLSKKLFKSTHITKIVKAKEYGSPITTAHKLRAAAHGAMRHEGGFEASAQRAIRGFYTSKLNDSMICVGHESSKSLKVFTDPPHDCTKQRHKYKRKSKITGIQFVRLKAWPKLYQLQASYNHNSKFPPTQHKDTHAPRISSGTNSTSSPTKYQLMATLNKFSAGKYFAQEKEASAELSKQNKLAKVCIKG